MRISVITITLFWLSLHSLFAHPGQVVKSFPLNQHFATGLTFDGSHLWLADYHEDKIVQIDPATGKVVKKIPSPGFWPAGLAWDGSFLWNIDAKQKKIFQIDPLDGHVRRVIDAPTDFPEGLTWDGQTLWLSDSKRHKIIRIDLSDGTAVQKFAAPSRRPQGLTFDGTYLWCADRYKDELYMIDPATGAVIAILDAPGPYARGMAWDGQYLWNVDFQTDSLYQLVRKDDQRFVLYEQRIATITLTHEVTGYGSGRITSLQTFIAIPDDLPQQKILSVRFNPEKKEIRRDRWDQPVALFQYENIPTNQTVRDQMIVKAEIFAIRYFIFPDETGRLEDIPKDIREKYTADGSKYDITNPYIRELAKKIVGNEQNPYWMARRIFDYVRQHLEYKLEGGWNTAPVVLQRGTGSCSEYTFSFIALARAAGLPARYVGAIVVRGDDASMDDVFHRWPEVYLPNYGWIPIDPQGGDKPSPRDQAMNIGHLSNRFLITTHGGGDSEYLGWYYDYNERYQTDPKVKVNIETFAEWEPIK